MVFDLSTFRLSCAVPRVLFSIVSHMTRRSLQLEEAGNCRRPKVTHAQKKRIQERRATVCVRILVSATSAAQLLRLSSFDCQTDPLGQCPQTSFDRVHLPLPPHHI
eukprot:scaffold225_cov235-Pinguiococcus_pyrenoidosus.AAC.10